MGRSVNMVSIMVILVAALIQSSDAQTTHVVGDALGWLIPPSTTTYSTWASNKSFTVGDTLVFNYPTGNHDVAQVTRSAFDSCSSTGPISLFTTGPTSITLTSAGDHYFICTFGTHCSAGQKVAVNVSAGAATPAPQPSPSTPPPAATPTPTPTTTPSPPPSVTPTPTPSMPPSVTPTPTPSPSPPSIVSPTPAPSPVSINSPAPAPAPTASGEEYVVGDEMGWTVPTGGAEAYQTWAANKTFRVGDTLVFNFVAQAHTVGEVPSTAFNSCDITAATNVLSTSPARITLTSSGEHFYICTIPTHCTSGQKLAINVTTGSSANPPPSDTVAPPPPNDSGPSLAVATLPVTLLSIAMALFY